MGRKVHIKTRLVYGVGVNDTDYVVQIKENFIDLNDKVRQKLVWICPFYQTWVDMLKMHTEHGYLQSLKKPKS